MTLSILRWSNPAGGPINFQLFHERKEKVGERSITEFSCTNKGGVPREEKFKAIKNNRKNKVAHKGDFIFGLSRSLMNFGMLDSDQGCFSPACWV